MSRFHRCPKCGHENIASDTECVCCGIVFEKYSRAQRTREYNFTVNTDSPCARNEKQKLGMLDHFFSLPLGIQLLLVSVLLAQGIAIFEIFFHK